MVLLYPVFFQANKIKQDTKKNINLTYKTTNMQINKL